MQEEGIVSTRVDERGLKRIQVEREDYEGFAKLVKNGVHMDDPGLRRNLSALRADPEWAKKARDQHRVLRAITSLGPRTDLEHLVSASGVHAARVRTILGDLETEGYALTDYEEETDTLRVEVPPTTYPKDRFERNLAVISEAEAAQPMLPPFWWVLLGIAGILLVLFIASRFVV